MWCCSAMAPVSCGLALSTALKSQSPPAPPRAVPLRRAVAAARGALNLLCWERN